MTLLEFPQPARQPIGRWSQQELQQLMALGLATGATTQTSGWASGTTEEGDPQFYLLGPEPEEDCILCVTRVRGEYLLEDGSGGLLAQGRQLDAVLRKAERALTRRPVACLFVRAFLGLCAIRAVLEPLYAKARERALNAFEKTK